MSKKSFHFKSNKVVSNYRWSILITIVTFGLSVGINLLSSLVLKEASIFLGFFVLLWIIAIGILFDIIGLSVATAQEAPFHSLAARRVRGAREAILLLRSAQQVSNLCNDVIGDIAGVIAGASSATIAVSIATFLKWNDATGISLILTAVSAAITVGGKAVGKGVALKYNNSIMFTIGKLCYYIKWPFKALFKRR